MADLSYEDRPIVTTPDYAITITTLDNPGQYLLFDRRNGKACAVRMDGSPIIREERLATDRQGRILVEYLLDYMDDAVRRQEN